MLPREDQSLSPGRPQENQDRSRIISSVTQRRSESFPRAPPVCDVSSFSGRLFPEIKVVKYFFLCVESSIFALSKQTDMRLAYQLKTAFENTTMSARTNGPREAYDYAERMYRSSRNAIDEQLETLATELEKGNTGEVIRKLRTIMKE